MSGCRSGKVFKPNCSPYFYSSTSTITSRNTTRQSSQAQPVSCCKRAHHHLSSNTPTPITRSTSTSNNPSTSSIPSITSRYFSSTPNSFSGSNKWSKIKHKKAAQDAIKGNAYGSLSREILSCIKASPLSKDLASLPEHNSRLSYLLKKAKDLDIPKDKLELTLQKARSNGSGGGEETVVYEVLGMASNSTLEPNNESEFGSGSGQPIALVIECTTDSTSRTIAKLKESLNKMHFGFRLGSTGHLFDKIGRIWLNLNQNQQEESSKVFDEIFDLVVENGAEEVRWLDEEEWIHLESFGNVKEKGEGILEIICPPTSLRQISSTLTSSKANYSVLLSEQSLIPSGPTIRIIDSDPNSNEEVNSNQEDLENVGGYVDESFVEKLDKLAELLEETADAQRIFSNLQGWQWPR